MKWFIDVERYKEFFALPQEERQDRVIKVVFMTSLWFLPFGIGLANLWVFYVLYEGLGLWITAALNAIYFMAMILYIERQLSQQPARNEVQDVLKKLLITSVLSLAFLMGFIQL
jgi:hypothetical protein